MWSNFFRVHLSLIVVAVISAVVTAEHGAVAEDAMGVVVEKGAVTGADVQADQAEAIRVDRDVGLAEMERQLPVGTDLLAEMGHSPLQERLSVLRVPGLQEK